MKANVNQILGALKYGSKQDKFEAITIAWGRLNKSLLKYFINDRNRVNRFLHPLTHYDN